MGGGTASTPLFPPRITSLPGAAGAPSTGGAPSTAAAWPSADAAGCNVLPSAGAGVLFL